eukprot:TRINITY_DN66291_c5_g2_i1.p1 TRINITY_DN66291_c5_g2~~TRINITY_DN66291_c5_g2_i1.p1  ORF type:complete len:1951 (+),score=1116.81 TRINITY_DN66291_c5_g2_i1:135-5855(+)
MYVTLQVPESGVIHLLKPAGSILDAGDLLGTLDLDFPERVQQATLFDGKFPAMLPPNTIGDQSNMLLHEAVRKLKLVMDGYKLAPGTMQSVVEDMMRSLRDARLPLLEFEHILSTLTGRIPEDLHESLVATAEYFADNMSTDRFYWEAPVPFPVDEVLTTIDDALLDLEQSPAEQTALRSTMQPITELMNKFRGGNHVYAVSLIRDMIQQYLSVETIFRGHRVETVIKNLRRAHKDDFALVANLVQAHYQLPDRNRLVLALLQVVESQMTPLMSEFMGELRDLSKLHGSEYSSVTLKTRQLLMRSNMPSTKERRVAIQTLLSTVNASMSTQERLQRLAALIDQSHPIADMIFTFFDDRENETMRCAAMQVYIQRVFQIYTITAMNVEVVRGKGLLVGSWCFSMPVSSNNNNNNSSSGNARSDDGSDLGEVSSPTSIASATASASSSLTSSAASSRQSSVPSSPDTYDQLASPSFGSVALNRVDSVAEMQTLILGNHNDDSPRILEPISDATATTKTAATAVDKTPPSKRRTSASRKKAGRSIMRRGVIAFSRNFDRLKRNFDLVLEKLSANKPGELYRQPVNVIYLICQWPAKYQAEDDALVEYFQSFLHTQAAELRSHQVRRITFVVSCGEEYPRYFTFRHSTDYSEDALVRHLEPSYSAHLELKRLSNFNLQFMPTSNRMVHVFAAHPIESELEKSKRRRGAYDGRRMFARVMVRRVDAAYLRTAMQNSGDYTADAASGDASNTDTAALDEKSAENGGDEVKADESSAGGSGVSLRRPLYAKSGSQPDLMKAAAATAAAGGGEDDDVSVDSSTHRMDRIGRDLDEHPETEFAFVEALHAIEVAMAGDPGKWRNNSVFLNVLIDTFVSIKFVMLVIRQLARRYAEKIRRLKISQVEVQLNMRNPATGELSPMRFVSSNETGAVLNINVYAVRPDPKTGAMVFHSLDKGAPGPWHLQPITTPYATTSPFQKQRETAERVGTTYVYDFPVLIEKSLRQIWRRYAREHKSSNLRPGAQFKGRFVEATELVIDDITKLDTSSTAARRASARLVPSQRAPGLNRVGMVAWLLKLFTPEYPDGRQVVLIANDIAFQAGTFGPNEDLVFQLASEFAREHGLPRLYFAANSGARIGLADEVKDRLRIAWVNDDPNKGFDYLYLTDADYQELQDSVSATRVLLQDSGEVRWMLTDIVGRKDGMGVENLSGSGMIAGETSRAYEEVFTLTYVTGRTVGIGAYLARLGQRCIQKVAPPILLTGYNALNKLLGREVYSSNSQLGGPDIMYTNGVSHMTVEDDLEGVHAVLQWLSFVPSHRAVREDVDEPSRIGLSASPAALTPLDPIDRDVTFRPSKSPYDPRHLLEGAIDESTGLWRSGFFDRGSFMEVLGGWARSVVTGRARLGGIPMGVIAVETRTVEQTIPADPANATSTETTVQRAGQVWFPDSAFKTAQAIDDMVAEDLPIMIFANWRGFSGGMQDMFDEVLKFGSYIVDSLRKVREPVFVYLPPFGTLRGGAWVVVDSTINEQCMEMYADNDARGGVLEPEGTVDVKFRKAEVLKHAHRLDKQLQELDQQLTANTERQGKRRAVLEKEVAKKSGDKSSAAQAVFSAGIDMANRLRQSLSLRSLSLKRLSLNRNNKASDASGAAAATGVAAGDTDGDDDDAKAGASSSAASELAAAMQSDSQMQSLQEEERTLRAKIRHRESVLVPLYHQMASAFADLHDTPGRMKAKGVIRDIVKWRGSRRYFYWRLRRRLVENEYAGKITKATSSLRGDSRARLQQQAYLRQVVEQKSDEEQKQNNKKQSLVTHEVDEVYKQSLAKLREWFDIDHAQLGDAEAVAAKWADDRYVVDWEQRQRAALAERLQQHKKRGITNDIVALAFTHPDGFQACIADVVRTMNPQNLAALKQALAQLQ